MVDLRYRCLLFSLGLALCSAGHADVTGYLKSLWLNTDTVVGDPQNATLGIQRARVSVVIPIQSARLEFSVDEEIYNGNYLKTQQYQLQSATEISPYWHLQKTWHHDTDWVGRHGLYRGTLSIPLRDMEIRWGRQQINWARGFLWSSLDRFNPYDPLQLEPDERKGVDALQMRLSLGPLQSLEAVTVGGHDESEKAYGLNWKTHLYNIDADWVIADYGAVDAGGWGAAGQWANMGWRLEATRNRNERQREFNEVVASADYSFDTQTTLIVEALYRGDGATHPGDYDVWALLTNKRTNLAKHYWGVLVKQGFEPMANVDVIILQNIDDHSTAWIPSVRFSLARWENTYFRLSTQRFFGNANSEYGRLSTVVLGEIQWFY